MIIYKSADMYVGWPKNTVHVHTQDFTGDHENTLNPISHTQDKLNARGNCLLKTILRTNSAYYRPEKNHT